MQFYRYKQRIQPSWVIPDESHTKEKINQKDKKYMMIKMVLV